MPVITKRKKGRKPHAHKQEPYPDLQRSTNQNEPNITELSYEGSLKSSKYTDPEKIKNGGNPVFQFPIPKNETLKPTILNDEVDMYFPRKHFLSKFQIYNELLNNVMLKYIPTEKIIPPRLFPLPFVEGVPFEKKKAFLLENFTKNETPIGKDGKERAKRELSEQEREVLERYVQERVLAKQPTDFLFGDLQTMKMLEKNLADDANSTPVTKLEMGEMYNYSMNKLDELHNMINKFTAGSIDDCEKQLIDIEKELNNKFKRKYVESEKIKQFETNAFDPVKRGITLEEYNARKVRSVPQSQIQIQQQIQQQIPMQPSSQPQPPQTMFTDSSMLYGQQAFDNDDDGDFGSLTNEVFLNM